MNRGKEKKQGLIRNTRFGGLKKKKQDERDGGKREVINRKSRKKPKKTVRRKINKLESFLGESQNLWGREKGRTGVMVGGPGESDPPAARPPRN